MVLTNSLLDFFITKARVYKFERAVLFKTMCMKKWISGWRKASRGFLPGHVWVIVSMCTCL